MEGQILVTGVNWIGNFCKGVAGHAHAGLAAV